MCHARSVTIPELARAASHPDVVCWSEDDLFTGFQILTSSSATLSRGEHQKTRVESKVWMFMTNSP
jgi:hypothetical protein